MSTQTDAKKGGSDSNVSEVEARKLVPESSATSDPADNTSEDGSEDLGPGVVPARAPEGINPPEGQSPEAKDSGDNIWQGEMSKLKDGEKGQQETSAKSSDKVVKRQLSFKGDEEESSSLKLAKTPEKIEVVRTERASKPSPKLQALKARAAARRVSAKQEASRPSTAPASESTARTALTSSTARDELRSSASELTTGRIKTRPRTLSESQLRTRVDEMSDLIREKEKENEEALAEIKSLTKKHQEIEETTIKHYESIIDNLESEVKSLGVKVQEAESLTLRQKILNAEESDDIKISEAEFNALRKEIEEQEVLLKGYQSENESAILKLKQMKEDMKDKEEKMAEEHATYARDMIVMQEERRVDSQKTASWLREKLELQKQTNALKEEVYQSELKYKAEIERMRREKQELEARAAGVDLKQIEKEEELVKSVKAEMESMKKEHKTIQADLESKLRWYSENQEFVNQNSDLIKEQAQTISELKRRLSKFEGDAKDGSPESQMAIRIKELETEVAHLNDLLVKNNPNSLSALIQASKPSPEESAHVKELQSEIESQKRRNSELLRKHESQLRGLRQQHERTRIRDRETKQSGKVKELSKQLEDVRSHYGKKVKTLEKQLLDVKKEKVHYQESLRETRRKSRLSESSQNADNEKELAMIQNLKIELEQAKDEREQLRSELQKTRESIPAQSDSVKRLERQVQELSSKLNGLGTNTTTAHPFAQQAQQHYNQQQQHSYGHFSTENLMDVNVMNRMRQLENEIAYLKGNKVKSSSYSPEYIVLEEKFAQMDARQMAREEQWRAVMEETKHLASLQQNVLNQKWELAIRAKNAEIDRFRTELDAILFDVSNLQRKGKV